MNEEQFRKRLGGALGEPPPTDLRRQLETKLTVGPSRRPAFPLGPLAATLALLIVALLVGWRLLYLRGLLSTGPVAPAVEQVTLAELEARPLHLPVLQPGAVCPAGPFTTINPGTGAFSALGAGPVYGAPGPRTLTAWGSYFDVTGLTGPKLTGLVLVRGRDLESGRPLVFVGRYATGAVFGTDTIDGQQVQQYLELVFDAGHHEAASGTSKWGIWPIRDGLAKGESGCTGFQFDGAGFSEVFVSHHTPSP